MPPKARRGRKKIRPVDEVKTTIRIRKPLRDALKIWARGAGLTMDRAIETAIVQLTKISPEGK